MKVLNRGFSLIELMIVIAIIGILAAIAIPSYKAYVLKAKISTVMTMVDSMALALSVAHEETGSFPNSITTSYGEIAAGTTSNSNVGDYVTVVHYNKSVSGNSAWVVAYFSSNLDADLFSVFGQYIGIAFTDGGDPNAGLSSTCMITDDSLKSYVPNNCKTWAELGLT